ncbi:NTP transferase domain-containing protein [Novosphingobium sp. FSW06-99]|uniref:phosphocholine cytidylyltransferase family protein n=1 Tax=Novosphingobium sp. FSW06-99 TaxID=1739113 RepID=UPI00076C9AFD|nr:NTP transferase domain-containing protein [Novosphingobium sp. FSW06-99]KUR75985.1 nucleotidyl transferase [Novosphingobium sp. FSW06-99]
MDALIIAAGYGSRLAALSPSKPLTPVCGIPIIELSIRQAVLAGITRVVVVTGHEANRLEMFLADLSLRLGIAIVPVRLSDWSTPNGHSVIAGATRCEGNYLLMMADHLFDVEILSRLITEAPADCGLTLAIDRRIDSPLIDPEDATWVETDTRGMIRAIGKTITPYDAVDCGAFLATPELAPAIRAAIASGKAGSLSEGVQVLAAYNRAATLDIEDAWWIDIDDPHYHALAEETAMWHFAQALAETGPAEIDR